MIPRRLGPLTSRVIELAGRAMRSTNPGLSQAGRRVQRRLGEPLCVALVGRVSAGKSTLLNALLELAIAPTAGGECTKVLYIFRHGNWTGAEIRSRDGSEIQHVSFDQTLPTVLSMPAARIRSVDVTLASPLLEHTTLVDTPGLASTNEETSDVTRRLLTDTTEAAADADALLFCLNGPLHQDEEQTVRSFRGSRGAPRLTAGTAVGVLTKADQVSEDRRTVWKQACKLADDMSKQHADLFAVVLPVVGLLAETATTGALREKHARALVTIAQEWNSDETDDALLHRDLFLDQPCSLSTQQRRELLNMLGLFGIGELLDSIRAGKLADAAALTRLALAVSGFDEMYSRLRAALDNRADVLKAAAALEDLMEHAYVAGDSEVRTAAQDMLDLPEMFPLRVLEMAQQLAKGRVRPPAGLIEQAWTTVQTGLAPAKPAAAARAAAEWREWAMVTDSAGRRLADVMVRAWQLAAGEGGHHG